MHFGRNDRFCFPKVESDTDACGILPNNYPGPVGLRTSWSDCLAEDNFQELRLNNMPLSDNLTPTETHSAGRDPGRGTR